MYIWGCYGGLAFENVHALVIQVVSVASCVIEVPGPIEVVDLWSPYAAASVGCRVLVDDPWSCSLEALNCGRTRELEVGPLSRNQVIVAIKP